MQDLPSLLTMHIWLQMTSESSEYSDLLLKYKCFSYSTKWSTICFIRMEYEMHMRKTVEADVARLRKDLDGTNIIRLHVESDIESLTEELITLKKNYETVSGKLF